MLSFDQSVMEKAFLHCRFSNSHTQRVHRTSESIANSAKCISSNLICLPKGKVSINRLLTCDK